MAAARPTPVDPFPGVTALTRESGDQRAMPPELGTNSLAVLSGPTFLYSDSCGDVPPGSIGGLVHMDTRLISGWVVTLNGARLLALRGETVDHYSAQFVLTNPEMPGLPPDSVGARRLRYIGGGLHERVELFSFRSEPSRVELRLAVATDFADLFEVKSGVRERSTGITRSHSPAELRFDYTGDGFDASTVVRSDPPATRVEGDDLVWEIDLPPRGGWQVDLDVPLEGASVMIDPIGGDIAGVIHHRNDNPLRRWAEERAVVRSEHPLLARTLDQSRLDLTALRLDLEIRGQRVMLPGAGLPWFLTVFGRDTLITAYQTLVAGPALAQGALLALARLQGRTCDDFTDEEPGKILHEFRSGELTRTGAKPYNPNYGTADATQLWLILLSEYWRWTGDDDLVRSLGDNARAALRWIDEYGDRDGDGYVEYGTRSAEGLGNQCWRDSPDGVRFSDGRLPVLPIATSDLQGYTYDSKVRLAELADGPLADPALARRLRAEAADLHDRFNRDFWIEERGGFYATGLDGDKNRIDSKTSNMGHLLWSGIVPAERAGTVVGQLMHPDMFSGWGIRTLSREDQPYNALGYHLGTVWPHDSSLAVLGMARYGYRAEANQVSVALLEAAEQFGHRLPEAMSGFDRRRTLFAIPYPTACSPQAWAAGAPLALVRAMLGIQPDGGRLVLDPDIPPEVGRISAERVRAFGKRWELEANGRAGHVLLSRT
ncbi:glycogen debranching N-terminal domain-containing protein [Micromonospora endolithica]|uniref:Glycogen debranching protein n=1 Tax=Micromonospora endolithica TaxID=230091 RepID=A0A3A9ZJR2_9ACTN|nr:glycogen debranching N-terminal domain-containing protein [Micromonospora endolithica]RKN48562.1 glycogen debranching protein [Micromonospora endolithica]TWJ22114.1 glycogen debranching enzyme [Micromonospora endolithica]